jgi:predicted phosphodiesterase
VSGGLRVGVLSDLHCSVDPDERASWHNPYDFAGLAARIDSAIAWFAAEDVDRVVLAGDLTHHAHAPALQVVLQRCLRACPQALLVVAGNHDVGGRTPPEDEIVGACTPRLALARPAGDRHGDVRLAGVHVERGEGWFHATLREPPAVGAWGEDPVLLISHFPLLSHAVVIAEHGLAHPGDMLDRAAIAQRLIERSAPTVVVSGHVHARVTDARGSVLQLTQAALIEPPFDAAIVELAPQPAGGLHVTRRTLRAGPARAHYEPAFADPDGAWSFDGAGWSPVRSADPLATGAAHTPARQPSAGRSQSRPVMTDRARP